MHVVCQWIGNSQPIAAKHYLQVTDDHVSKAVRNPVQQPRRVKKLRRPLNAEVSCTSEI